MGLTSITTRTVWSAETSGKFAKKSPVHYLLKLLYYCISPVYINLFHVTSVYFICTYKTYTCIYMYMRNIENIVKYMYLYIFSEYIN